MSFATWHDLYRSDLQSAVAVTIVPLLFLLYLAWTERPDGSGIVPGARRFVEAWAGTFAVLTVVDPLAGGPLLRVLGVADAPVATAVMVAFVLLGDFRVYLLVFALMTHAGAQHDARVADPVFATRDALRLVPPRAALAAALATLVVPLVAVAAEALVRTRVAAPPAQSIWLAYELAFLVVALALRQWVVPVRVPGTAPRLRIYLRRVLAYVATYYALWALADALIIAGLDLGWALRILPNQLYYAFWVPFAYGAFFARR
ncbi:MAG: hypothetical protein IT293_03990 [Deltaproteobacteria bacterium]|nr:hypothetical protein [Deltaproteobacteria bacterium]